MQAEVVRAALTALRAAYDEVAACGIDMLTCDELLAAATNGDNRTHTPGDPDPPDGMAA